MSARRVIAPLFVTFAFLSSSSRGQVPATSAQRPPRLERIADVGCDGCGDARELARVLDLVFLPRGELLIVDGEAPMLRRFDASGALRWSGGRAGNGPGEYAYPMRTAARDDGSLRVLDMRHRRVTFLTPDGGVRRTLPFRPFPAAVAARGTSGELYVIAQDFRGNFALERWLADADSLAPTSIRWHHDDAQGFALPSVAAATDGEVAIAPDANVYRIDRTTADGLALPPLQRTVDRVRRSVAEQAELDERIRRGPGRAMRAEESRLRGAKPAAAPAPPAGAGPTLKPHFAPDALRYDDEKRLWVHTMRGDERTTIFDLFSSSGTVIGSLPVAGRVTAFAVSGDRLATAMENGDGVPLVVLWRVIW